MVQRDGRLLAGYLADPRHGPLPALLIALTVATGVVDAVSILGLGRVFVANMTGNIAFVGFALAGAPGFSLSATATALAGFLIGASVGGWGVTRYGSHRGVLLRNATAVELALLLAATALTAASATPFSAAVRDVTVALAGVALGLQNATVRRLAVPDLTTTVLTMTLTGIAADLHARKLAVAIRRVLAVLALLLGAVAGALLVRHVSTAAALGTATGLVAVVLVGVSAASRRPQDWHRGPS